MSRLIAERPLRSMIIHTVKTPSTTAAMATLKPTSRNCSRRQRSRLMRAIVRVVNCGAGAGTAHMLERRERRRVEANAARGAAPPIQPPT